jgi:FkbM family methyltransferase
MPELFRCVGRVRNWAGVARRFLGFGGSFPVVFAARDGTRVVLNSHHDLVTAWVIYCRDEYVIPADARLIVDLGANISLFVLRAARRAPAADIIAIEPFPACYDQLTAAVAANALADRVTCWRFAVAGTRGVRHMGLSGPTQSNGLFPDGSKLPDAVLPVPSVTLPDVLDRVRDAYPGRPIDLLKIDVEGAEHEFIPGLPDGALSQVRAVTMEYHPNGEKRTLFAALLNQGLHLIVDRPVGPDSGVASFARKGG